MNYKESLNFLFASLPMYQRIGQAAYKANLNNTIALDTYLGKPHKKFKSIHIAGTNGKGSVSHMLAAVLQVAGYKTGLYTSPHLKDFRERIRVNGIMIDEDYVAEFITKNLGFIKKIEPSFFEMSVALAFQYFADEKVDIAIIETGMGGRLDSTNIIHPLVCAITNIGLDHTQFLGNTIPDITAEKAGIIKSNVPTVIGEWQEETDNIFSVFSKKLHSDLYYASVIYQISNILLSKDRMQVMNVNQGNNLLYERLKLDLLGQYQRKNVPTVLQILELLKTFGFSVSKQVIYDALSKVKPLTGLRGRWDEIAYNPLIVCDTGHNISGLTEVMNQIIQIPYKKLHIVIGLVSDKNPDYIFPLFPPDAEYYFTKAEIPRAFDPLALKESAKKYNLRGNTYPSVISAVDSAKAKAGKEDLIFIGGSNFIVAEALP